MKKIGKRELPKYLQDNFLNKLSEKPSRKYQKSVIVIDEVLPTELIEEIDRKLSVKERIQRIQKMPKPVYGSIPRVPFVQRSGIPVGQARCTSKQEKSFDIEIDSKSVVILTTVNVRKEPFLLRHKIPRKNFELLLSLRQESIRVYSFHKRKLLPKFSASEIDELVDLYREATRKREFLKA